MNRERTGEIIAIAACGKPNNLIAIDGEMPWNEPEDLKFFNRQTMGHIVIMGRKTMESIPNQHLHGRINIVLSKTLKQKNLKTIKPSIELAIEKIKPSEDIYIIGGQEIFEQSLKFCSKIIITKIPGRFPIANKKARFFPEISKKEWRIEKTFRNMNNPKLKHIYYARKES